MKRLPLGIQTFEKIIEGDYFYTDKTRQIYDLLNYGNWLFLSRPRRFGKSLLSSTLSCILSGRRELFKGLWIDQSDYAWPEYNVIYIDFSQLSSQSGEAFESGLLEKMLDYGKQFAIDWEVRHESQVGSVFARLLEKIREKTGRKTAVIIDEYDSPIAKNCVNTDGLPKFRACIADFFTALKGSDAHLSFVFLTGVTKFSKLSVFSSMNNLEDVSLEEEFAGLLGFTDEDLDGEQFQAYLERLGEREGLDLRALREEIKRWYNGYCFSREEAAVKVYSPFSVLLLLKKRDFSNYWYESATPRFAVQKLKESIHSFEDYDFGVEIVREEVESSSNLEDLRPHQVLFQAGYLTIKSYDKGLKAYRLAFPNEEVKQSFARSFLDDVFKKSDRDPSKEYLSLYRNIAARNFDAVFESFSVLLKKLPYEDYHKSKEGFYRSLFMTYLLLSGHSVSAEDHTNQGRIDLILESPEVIFLVECKLDKSAELAMEQIKEKDYPGKYADSGKELLLAGVNFSSEKRNIDSWIIEKQA